MDNEVAPAIAVFSIVDGKALDIQQLNSAVQIPLGFSLRDPAREWRRLEELVARGYADGKTNVIIRIGNDA